MAVSKELDLFVREALRQELPRAEIERALVEAGWPKDQAQTALMAYAEMTFPIPVPRPRSASFARDAFFFLLLFTSLYFAAFNLGSLLFAFINRAFPDPASSYAYSSSWDSMRFETAAIIIAFPLYLLMSGLIEREARRDSSKRASSVKKWLTYMTLFVASAVLIGDATSLVYNALGGELTVRFLLKVLVVGGLSGSIFSYYLADLRKGEARA